MQAAGEVDPEAHVPPNPQGTQPVLRVIPLLEAGKGTVFAAHVH